ncbi:MAG TPA: L,D-transpeptidase [Ignavibacteria bacterium]
MKKYRFLFLLGLIAATGLVFTKNDYSQEAHQSTRTDSSFTSEVKVVENKTVAGYQTVSLPISDIQNADRLIESYLHELFPIISDNEISAIQGSKEITKKLINDTLGIVDFNLNFKIPDHYLDPHPKILWELNIPEFTSRIFQLYKEDTILIDTWPNVVGKPSTKTYTGHYEAFRLRNWPTWKDPESDPLEPATPPGPGNPLGLFCVHYDENSLRYFHGTNKNYLLKSEYRALSHGCVRNDNSNIEKMKKFICTKVIISSDIAWWINSKKSMMFEISEQDRFPVRIKYKTFNIESDGYGDYIVFFKDIYGYGDGSGWSKFDEPELMTFTNTENILAEYKAAHKPNQFSISDEKLIPIIEKLIANHKDYEKYYFEDLLSESGF